MEFEKEKGISYIYGLQVYELRGIVFMEVKKERKEQDFESFN